MLSLQNFYISCVELHMYILYHQPTITIKTSRDPAYSYFSDTINLLIIKTAGDYTPGEIGDGMLLLHLQQQRPKCWVPEYSPVRYPSPNCSVIGSPVLYSTYVRTWHVHTVCIEYVPYITVLLQHTYCRFVTFRQSYLCSPHSLPPIGWRRMCVVTITLTLHMQPSPWPFSNTYRPFVVLIKFHSPLIIIMKFILASLALLAASAAGTDTTVRI